MHAPHPKQAPFAPLRRIDGRFEAGVLFLCDHASPALPEAYGDLGLTPEHFTRHIAYDIGAAALTEALAAAIGVDQQARISGQQSGRFKTGGERFG